MLGADEANFTTAAPGWGWEEAKVVEAGLLKVSNGLPKLPGRSYKLPGEFWNKEILEASRHAMEAVGELPETPRQILRVSEQTRWTL